ncbi:hypothetical protein MUN74_09220 [Agromyces endophyticus]|uniref:hypothetical protein n=1 Tax=Agromyces sp. H17E-10 TaxID=2932244 RepID=UPI001FD1009F|nr:hypothetical protein [Agromyces sp. H17E-10]UOQ91049.1 hypothetical protein MUN74_09220 [Agromyces sp. H17E-10]
MNVFPIVFDPDRWIRVPVDWTDEQWPDAESWASWVADEVTRDRGTADDLIAAIRDQAVAVATFPTEHVGARFWYFPVDSDPRGWLDLYVQRRDPDGTTARELLPGLDRTLIDPVVDELEGEVFDDFARRLSLVPLGERQLGEGHSGILAKAEWLAITGGWVVYGISVDDDPRWLTQRLADGDRLVAGMDQAALAALAGGARA